MGKIREAIEINKDKEGYTLKNLINANKNIVKKLDDLSIEIKNITGIDISNVSRNELSEYVYESNRELFDSYYKLYNESNVMKEYAVFGTDLRVNLTGMRTMLYKEIDSDYSDSYFDSNPNESEFCLDSYNLNQIDINCKDDTSDYYEAKLMNINDLLNGIKIQGTLPNIIKINM